MPPKRTPKKRPSSSARLLSSSSSSRESSDTDEGPIVPKQSGSAAAVVVEPKKPRKETVAPKRNKPIWDFFTQDPDFDKKDNPKAYAKVCTVCYMFNDNGSWQIYWN